MKNNATSIWHGKGIDGNGSISTQSNALKNIPYTYKTRFEGSKAGTNPEELVAAAHAGCFAMKLAFVLESEGYVADELVTNCEVTLEAGLVTNAHLTLKAKIPSIDKATFDDLVANSGQNCPISKLFNASVSIDAALI